jgi:perosamine synthetase
VIPVAIPFLGDEEAAAAQDAIRSGWVTQGPRVAAFERAVAERCGTAHAVAVTNCTTALHLSLVALSVGPGDEVIVPSMSFIATANAVRHAGALPVFADVDPRTFNLDPDAAEAAITSRTKAIMPVHQIGLPADMDRFLALGKRRGIAIVEDAACAIGSRYKGRPVGGDGVMACFSFHPRKVLTTGEGGVITTNDAVLADRLRLLRQHGMSVKDTERHTSTKVITEEYLVAGYNYRMTDVQGAMGVEQMKKLDGIVARRRELAARYAAGLAKHPWITAPFVPDYAEPNFQSYAVTLATSAPVSRADLMQRLLDEGIATRRGIMCSHVEPPYVGTDSCRHPLPASEDASARSLLIPLYPQLTSEEQDTVIAALHRGA